MTRLRQGSGGRARPMDIREISELLAGRALELCHSLLPLGSQRGHEWVEASTKAGGLGDSLSVHLSGQRAGVWGHFAAGRQGDALDLVAYILCDDDKGRAVRWARAWLGLDTADPAALEVKRREAAARSAEAQEAAEREDEQKREGAFRLWLSAEQKLFGTPADLYLKSRGIDLARLGRQPGCLRYHPNLWNGESGGRHFPALLAGISAPNGKMAGVHRTWLARDPIDAARWIKPGQLKDPKMTLGRYRGGSIRLWRGAGGKALKEAAAGSAVAITEGIEDGLSLALAMPELRILAAVSLANMAALALPEAITTVFLCADNDPPRSAAARALDRAVEAHVRAGRRVMVVRAEGAKDLNALLTGDPA